MSTVKGTARVHGLGDSAAIAFTGLAVTSGASMRQATLKDASQIKRFINGAGRIKGFSSPERLLEISIEFYPISIATSTPTETQAKDAMYLPVGPCKVTLSGFKDSSTAQINGDWIYETGAQVQLLGDDDAQVSMTLFRATDWTAQDVTNLLASVS